MKNMRYWKKLFLRGAVILLLVLLISACAAAEPVSSRKPVESAPPVQVLFPPTGSFTSPPLPTQAEALPTEISTDISPTKQSAKLAESDNSHPNNPPRPVFDTFVDRVKNGDSEQIVGVYVENILALPVVQQPINNPAYVSTRDGEATQFLLAFTYAGNTGLLAHNFLSGKLFFNLKEGDIVQIIYGSGHVREYEIIRFEEYQALSPSSPTSDFLDLANGDTLSAASLFYRVYGGDHLVTFQTCIAQDNSSEWGRFFAIATPF